MAGKFQGTWLVEYSSPTFPTLNNFEVSRCMKVIFTLLESPVNSPHMDLKISLTSSLLVVYIYYFFLCEQGG